MSRTDTIVAQATAPGRGGIGVVRLSGAKVPVLAQQLLGVLPKPRHAHYAHFRDAQGDAIDQGVAIYFAAPASFTGEHVLELQGHGGPVVMDALVQRCLELGARLAQPGEFSQRAFLNDKIDLAQAEAIADLIDAASTQSAKLAMRSLDGEFSKRVHALVEQLIHLRLYVEAAIDFPEEEIDFLADGHIENLLADARTALAELLRVSKQGQVLRDGIKVVIAGKPNAGKSSLLNALSGRDSAIVTDIPGTTRDVLRELITVDGLPVHLIDTAGLRHTDDKVEQLGIARAEKEMAQADALLLVVDGSSSDDHDPQALWPLTTPLPVATTQIAVVHNKCDLSGKPAGRTTPDGITVISLSAQTGDGLDALRLWLREQAGLQDGNESLFLARRRHLDALEQAREHLRIGSEQLRLHRAGELLAEDLRQAQQALSTITGAFTADDLLGRIFSSFCIGK